MPNEQLELFDFDEDYWGKVDAAYHPENEESALAEIRKQDARRQAGGVPYFSNDRTIARFGDVL